MGQARVDCSFHLAGICREVSGGAFGIGSEFCVAAFSIGNLYGGLWVALPILAHGYGRGRFICDHAFQCADLL